MSAKKKRKRTAVADCEHNFFTLDSRGEAIRCTNCPKSYGGGIRRTEISLTEPLPWSVVLPEIGRGPTSECPTS